MDREATCRNPPLEVFWEDNGIDEKDSMFVVPRPDRGNITSSPMMGKISIFFYKTIRNDIGEGLVEQVRAQYSQRKKIRN